MGIRVVNLHAVSDSGPFIHLHQIGLFELLALFKRLVTSDRVIAEVTRPKRLTEERIGGLVNLEVHPVTSENISAMRKRLVGFDLQEGELSALWLCCHLKINLFLTDDLEARRAAKFLGLEPHGSVGIIVLAHRMGKLTLVQSKKALRDLLDKSSLFLVPAIVEQAIQFLEQMETCPSK
jgi:hypothetical protein